MKLSKWLSGCIFVFLILLNSSFSIFAIDSEYCLAVDGLSQITSLKNYYPEKLDRYLDYKQLNPTLSDADIVLHVNIGLDKSFYSDVEEILKPDSFLVVCNKYNILPKGYAPEGYGKYDYQDLSLRKEAQNSFNLMQKDARNSGINIYLVSGYRGYFAQKEIYEHYKKQDPNNVDNFSSRPGSSEHQTGLAADINTVYSKDHFENTAEFRWLIENAYKYGFILRYPPGKEHITGYRFEPWHWRYVGDDVAMMVWEDDLTLEEFFAGLPVDY
ncbi:MAG: M15 family metallopeptidase [Defluviitaleaceae bacterium]|nr:M15 family metallopeptidase [Defluviitaleaceae bacterium]